MGTNYLLPQRMRPGVRTRRLDGGRELCDFFNQLFCHGVILECIILCGLIKLGLGGAAFGSGGKIRLCSDKLIPNR